MFCKNARSKIAMATPSPPEPATLPESRETQLMQQQKLLGGVDPAHMFLAGQGMDAQTKMLLEQQLKLCQSQVGMQQQQRPMDMPQQNQMQNNIMGMMDNGMNMASAGNMNMFQGTGGSNIASLHQEIQAQKQQQARMLQLQQLMALNLQKRRGASNNFRASAA
jgi:flagellar biosynthesis chaperone FliJ